MATHSFGTSLSALRELIADSDLWQAMVLQPEATYTELVATIDDTPERLDRAKALAAIVVGMFPTDEEGCDSVMPVPRILLRYDTDGQFTRESGTWTRDQTVLVLFETKVPSQWQERTAESFTAQEIDGQNKIGRILTDCNTVILSGIADRLQVETWTFGAHGLIAPEEADGEWLRTCEVHAAFRGAC